MRAMLRLLAYTLLFLVAMFGCVSDEKLVTESLAARHYHAGRFRSECRLGQKWPAYCDAYGHAVDDALDETRLANETQKLGKLPPSARKNLKQLMRRLEHKGGT